MRTSMKNPVPFSGAGFFDRTVPLSIRLIKRTRCHAVFVITKIPVRIVNTGILQHLPVSGGLQQRTLLCNHCAIIFDRTAPCDRAGCGGSAARSRSGRTVIGHAATASRTAGHIAVGCAIGSVLIDPAGRQAKRCQQRSQQKCKCLFQFVSSLSGRCVAAIPDIYCYQNRRKTHKKNFGNF